MKSNIIAILVIPLLATAIVLGAYTFLRYNHINTIIRENDQERFEKKLAAGDIDLSDTGFEEVMAAFRNENSVMFCYVVKHLPHYKIRSDQDTIKDILSSSNQELIDCYFDHSVFTGKKYELAAVKAFFLTGDLPTVEFFLNKGIDPNMTLERKIGKEYIDQILVATERRVRFVLERQGIGRPGWSHYRHKKIVDYEYDYLPIPGNYAPDELEAYADKKSKYRKTYFIKGQRTQKIAPLVIAAEQNNSSYAELLLQHGADPAYRLNTTIPVHRLTSDPELHLRLKLAAKPYTPLQQAIIRNDIKAFSGGAFIRQLKVTAKKKREILDFAIAHGSNRIVEWLIEHHQFPFDKTDQRLLFQAYRSENPWCLDYFVAKGMDLTQNVTHKQRPRGFRTKESPLSLMLAMKSKAFRKVRQESKKPQPIGRVLFNKALSEKKWSFAFVLDAHLNRWQPIHHAVVGAKRDAIKTMLQKKPDLLNRTDQSGRSPLALAAFYDVKDSIDLLLTYKPNLNLEDNRGYTALMQAANYGNLEMVETLVRAGAVQTTKRFPDCAVAATVVANRLGLVKPIEDILGTYARKGLSDERMNVHRVRKTKTYLVRHAKQRQLPLCVKDKQ